MKRTVLFVFLFLSLIAVPAMAGQTRPESSEKAYTDTATANMAETDKDNDFTGRLTAKGLPTANTDIVSMCPYGDTASTAGTTTGNSSENSKRDFITIGDNYRSRQRGTVTRIKIGIGVETGTTVFTIKIWRYNGATYDVVAETENLVSSLTSSSVNTLTLASPLSVEYGDYVGIYMENTTASTPFTRNGSPSGTAAVFYTDAGTEASDTAFDWSSENTLATSAIPIELWGPAPQIAVIGDSWVSRADGIGKGFANAFSATATYQNIGVSGNTTANILTRITDLTNTKARVAIIVGGINDLHTLGTMTEADYLNNLRLIMNYCRINNMIPIVVKIPPVTGFSIDSTATSDGDGGGTTVISTAFSNFDDYHIGWELTAGGETRTVTDYVAATDTATVSPAFSGQITSTTAIFLTAMSVRDDWTEAIAPIVASYGGAYFADVDYAVGQNNAASEATAANMWDIKTAYQDDVYHADETGLTAMGANIAAQVQYIGLPE